MKKLTARDTGLESAILNAVRSGNYVLGNEGLKFEKALADSQSDGEPCFAVGCNSGTDALILSLLASGVSQGDQIIVPSFTASPTVAAIVAVGAEPIFVDVHPRTWVIDVEKFGKAINARTKAVIAVHLYGNMADVPGIQRVLKCYERTDIVIIEDVAQALGATLQAGPLSRPIAAGLYGRFGAFSFYPTKNLAALGDAGAVFCRSEEDAEKIRTLRNYGQIDRYNCVLPRGLNSRLDEIQAAVLNHRLPKLVIDNETRNALTERYRKELSHLPIQFQAPTPSCRPAWHQCVIAVETQEQRDALIAHLEQQGVSVLIHYPIPTHAQIAFQRKSSAENTLDVTDSLSLRILSLPMNLVLEEKEQGHVIGVLKAFFEAFKQKSSQGETLQKTVICSQ